MGALVGATFASGVSAPELERAVLAIDWKRTVGGQGQRDRMPIERKLTQLTYSNPLEVGLQHGSVRLPGGLIATQEIEQSIRTLVAAARYTHSFDDLPIPFRAIATDMVAGEMVVLDGGDLAEAMRASMALPGVFSPVQIDGKVLSDGGITRNLPIDIARKLCADVVIAVWMSSPPPTAVRSELLAEPRDALARRDDHGQRARADRELGRGGHRHRGADGRHRLGLVRARARGDGARPQGGRRAARRSRPLRRFRRRLPDLAQEGAQNRGGQTRARRRSHRRPTARERRLRARGASAGRARQGRERRRDRGRHRADLRARRFRAGRLRRHRPAGGPRARDHAGREGLGAELPALRFWARRERRRRHRLRCCAWITTAPGSTRSAAAGTTRCNSAGRAVVEDGLLPAARRAAALLRAADRAGGRRLRGRLRRWRSRRALHHAAAIRTGGSRRELRHRRAAAARRAQRLERGRARHGARRCRSSRARPTRPSRCARCSTRATLSRCRRAARS